MITWPSRRVLARPRCVMPVLHPRPPPGGCAPPQSHQSAGPDRVGTAPTGVKSQKSEVSLKRSSGEEPHETRLSASKSPERELQLIREIADAFLRAQHPLELYRIALAQVTPLIDASFASVFLIDEADPGLLKLMFHLETRQLLGVHIIGPRATELIAEATVALRLESTVEELIRTIHAHPTMSEAIGEAAHAVHGAAIHI